MDEIYLEKRKKFWIVNIITVFFLISLFLILRSEKLALKQFSKESAYNSSLVAASTKDKKEGSKGNIEDVVNLSARNKKELNILMAGDIMLDRYIRKQINQNKTSENFVKNFLPNFEEENSKYDYVVANLEGPITENKSKTLNSDGTYGRDLLFTFPTSSVDILKLLNIKAVSLANNHADNFYHAGYESTKSFLEKSDIKYFGNPYNNSSALNSENLSNIICEKEICVAYIGYNQFTTNNSSEVIIEEIKLLKSLKNSDDSQKDDSQKVDFVVVVPHWGDEYSLKSNKIQQQYAREWIDAGADAIVGMHPHVIQDSEVYKDKNLYYSIGNYIFDQWFDKDVSKGLVLNFKFTKEVNENGNIKKSLTVPDKKHIKISSDKVIYEP